MDKEVRQILQLRGSPSDGISLFGTARWPCLVPSATLTSTMKPKSRDGIALAKCSHYHVIPVCLLVPEEQYILVPANIHRRKLHFLSQRGTEVPCLRYFSRHEGKQIDL